MLQIHHTRYFTPGHCGTVHRAALAESRLSFERKTSVWGPFCFLTVPRPQKHTFALMQRTNHRDCIQRNSHACMQGLMCVTIRLSALKPKRLRTVFSYKEKTPEGRCPTSKKTWWWYSTDYWVQCQPATLLPHGTCAQYSTTCRLTQLLFFYSRSFCWHWPTFCVEGATQKTWQVQ